MDVPMSTEDESSAEPEVAMTTNYTPRPEVPVTRGSSDGSQRSLTNAQKKYWNLVKTKTNQLAMEPCFAWFLAPVEPVAWDMINYYDVIKNPMDVITIITRLENNYYRDTDEWAADFQLMFSNCFMYNDHQNDVRKDLELARNLFLAAKAELDPPKRTRLQVKKEKKRVTFESSSTSEVEFLEYRPNTPRNSNTASSENCAAVKVEASSSTVRQALFAAPKVETASPAVSIGHSSSSGEMPVLDFPRGSKGENGSLTSLSSDSMPVLSPKVESFPPKSPSIGSVSTEELEISEPEHDSPRHDPDPDSVDDTVEIVDLTADSPQEHDVLEIGSPEVESQQVFCDSDRASATNSPMKGSPELDLQHVSCDSDRATATDSPVKGSPELDLQHVSCDSDGASATNSPMKGSPELDLQHVSCDSDRATATDSPVKGSSELDLQHVSGDCNFDRASATNSPEGLPELESQHVSCDSDRAVATDSSEKGSRELELQHVSCGSDSDRVTSTDSPMKVAASSISTSPVVKKVSTSKSTKISQSQTKKRIKRKRRSADATVTEALAKMPEEMNGIVKNGQSTVTKAGRKIQPTERFTHSLQRLQPEIKVPEKLLFYKSFIDDLHKDRKLRMKFQDLLPQRTMTLARERLLDIKHKLDCKKYTTPEELEEDMQLLLEEKSGAEGKELLDYDRFEKGWKTIMGLWHSSLEFADWDFAIYFDPDIDTRDSCPWTSAEIEELLTKLDKIPPVKQARMLYIIRSEEQKNFESKKLEMKVVYNKFKAKSLNALLKEADRVLAVMKREEAKKAATRAKNERRREAKLKSLAAPEEEKVQGDADTGRLSGSDASSSSDSSDSDSSSGSASSSSTSTDSSESDVENAEKIVRRRKKRNKNEEHPKNALVFTNEVNLSSESSDEDVVRSPDRDPQVDRVPNNASENFQSPAAAIAVPHQETIFNVHDVMHESNKKSIYDYPKRPKKTEVEPEPEPVEVELPKLTDERKAMRDEAARLRRINANNIDPDELQDLMEEFNTRLAYKGGDVYCRDLSILNTLCFSRCEADQDEELVTADDFEEQTDGNDGGCNEWDPFITTEDLQNENDISSEVPHAASTLDFVPAKRTPIGSNMCKSLPSSVFTSETLPGDEGPSDYISSSYEVPPVVPPKRNRVSSVVEEAVKGVEKESVTEMHMDQEDNVSEASESEVDMDAEIEKDQDNVSEESEVDMDAEIEKDQDNVGEESEVDMDAETQKDQYNVDEDSEVDMDGLDYEVE